MSLLECEIFRLLIDEQNAEQAVLLREKGPKGRLVPIVIGIHEAIAIDRALRGLVPPRPLTHELIVSLLEALSAVLTRVQIVHLDQGVYFGELWLEISGKPHIQDARPSDCIALASFVGCPIFVKEELLMGIPEEAIGKSFAEDDMSGLDLNTEQELEAFLKDQKDPDAEPEESSDDDESLDPDKKHKHPRRKKKTESDEDIENE